MNHTLVGLSIMGETHRIAADLELGPVAEASADRSVRALAALRHGDPTTAKRLFWKLVEERSSDWPAQLGLGAALSMLENRSVALVRALPSLEIDPRWKAVVLDWPVLTVLERRVVASCAQPLAAALPQLINKGAVIRLLPLNVRPTDVEGFRGLAGVKTEDGRGFENVAGMASSEGIAISRIEGLLDIKENLTFGHELAHLAFWHLPAPTQARFEKLYSSAREVRWAWTEYQQSNIDEFFAVSYEEWLGVRFGARQLPPDSSGLWAEVDAFFSTLNA